MQLTTEEIEDLRNQVRVWYKRYHEALSETLKWKQLCCTQLKGMYTNPEIHNMINKAAAGDWKGAFDYDMGEKK